MHRWIGALTGLVLAVPAGAATISEGTDLPNAFPPNIGTLDLGANTISGTIAGTCDLAGLCGTPGDPTDSFLITVLSGHEITALSVTSSGSDPSGFTTFSGIIGVGTVVMPIGNIYAFPLGSPLGAGDYQFFFSENDASGPGGYEANWQFTVDVASAATVPLPAAGWLALGGLGLLAALRRRGALPA